MEKSSKVDVFSASFGLNFEVKPISNLTWKTSLLVVFSPLFFGHFQNNLTGPKSLGKKIFFQWTVNYLCTWRLVRIDNYYVCKQEKIRFWSVWHFSKIDVQKWIRQIRKFHAHKYLHKIEFSLFPMCVYWRHKRHFFFHNSALFLSFIHISFFSLMESMPQIWKNWKPSGFAQSKVLKWLRRKN